MRACPDAWLTDLNEDPANLRLKRSHRHDQDRDKETLVKILKPFERKPLDHEVQDEHARYEEEDDAAKQSLAACPFEEINDPPDHQPDQKQLDDNDPGRIGRDPMIIVK